MIDWDSPEARLALIERVGADEYNRLFKEHQAETVIETVNGFDIRQVRSRFGQLYACIDQKGSLSMVAFASLDAARGYCREMRRDQPLEP